MLMLSRFCKRQSIRKKNQYLTPIEHWGLWYLFLVRILEVMGERITWETCHCQFFLSHSNHITNLILTVLLPAFNLLDIHVNEICSMWGIDIDIGNLTTVLPNWFQQICFNYTFCKIHNSFLGQNNNWREILEVKSILFSTYNSFYKSLIERKWAEAALGWCFTIR